MQNVNSQTCSGLLSFQAALTQALQSFKNKFPGSYLKTKSPIIKKEQPFFLFTASLAYTPKQKEN